MKQDLKAFVGRRLGELWLAGWSLAGAFAVGAIIWVWG